MPWTAKCGLMTLCAWGKGPLGSVCNVCGTGRRPATWQTLVCVLRDIELNSLADDIEHMLNPSK